MLIEPEMNESPWLAYVKQVSAVQAYALDKDQLTRVAGQMELLANVAEPLLALRLAAEVEPASIFRP
jgi:hypothetical protein